MEQMRLFEEDYSEILDPVLERIPFTVAIARIYAILDKLSLQEKVLLKKRVIEHFLKRGLQQKTFDFYVKDLEKIVEHKIFSYKVQNAKTVAAYIYQSMMELFPQLIQQVSAIDYSSSDIDMIYAKALQYKDIVSQINENPDILADKKLMDEIDTFTTESILKLSMLEQDLRKIFDMLERLRMAKQYAEELSDLSIKIQRGGD